MSKHARGAGAIAVFFTIAMMACTDLSSVPAGPESEPVFSVSSGPVLDEGVIAANLADLNAQLAAGGANYAIERVELSLAPAADPANPNVVFAFDRTLRLASRWVAGDARRLADGDNITYAHFTPLLAATGAGAVGPSIDAAFDTWNAVQCSKLPLVKRTLAPNVIPSAIVGAGGFVMDPFAADISTVGFLPGSIFDAVLGPGASGSVLGVTFTFVFIEFVGGPPTDINADGKLDTAIKEIWYNNAFVWSTNGTGGVDVESTALHEDGHALELGHFGRVAINFKTGKLTVSPRAVMNAFILGVLREPLGTDNGSYCGDWSNWPT
jgi:hypothetical protein